MSYKAALRSTGPLGALLVSRGMVPIRVLAGISDGCLEVVTCHLSANRQAGFIQPVEGDKHSKQRCSSSTRVLLSVSKTIAGV